MAGDLDLKEKQVGNFLRSVQKQDSTVYCMEVKVSRNIEVTSVVGGEQILPIRLVEKHRMPHFPQSFIDDSEAIGSNLRKTNILRQETLHDRVARRQLHRAIRLGAGERWEFVFAHNPRHYLECNTAMAMRDVVYD